MLIKVGDNVTVNKSWSNEIRSGAQTVQSALLLCECADIAWNLIGFNHMSEVEEYLEDVKRKALHDN